MIKKYKSIYNRAESEIIEKKSRFIGHAKPVDTQEAAENFIEQIKKQHYNATHNVFAYQIGTKNIIQRYSDDGEPSGTAGLPILSILQNEEITDIVIVVTRYYGGTLLGTGGLVRAYQLASKEVLKESIVIEKNLYNKISIKTDYNLSGKIQYEIMSNNHEILDTLYTDSVEYIILLENDLKENFIKNLIDITSNNIKIIEIEEIYASYIDGKINIF